MRTVLWIVIVVIALAILAFAPLPLAEAMSATRIVDRVDIAAPPARVFAYVTAPVNWPRWHPQSRAVTGIIDRTPQPGEQTIEDFEIAGRKGRAIWTSVTVDPPRRWEFEGHGEGGGGSAHIVYTLTVYTLTPTTSGTLFERELVYRGPNLLFAILNAARLRTVMEVDSAEAVRRLKRAVEALPSAS
jgi:uncharacterized protein YndB with AHSA1/START domain